MTDESRDYMIGWLRGFFDGEGSVYLSEDGKHYRADVSAVNTDKLLVDRAVDFLSRLGISSRVYTYQPKKAQLRYTISLTRRANVIRFAELVGFTTPRKADKLTRALEIGWVKNNGRYDPEQLAEMNKTMSGTEIARRLGLNASHVNKVLRDNGHPLIIHKLGRKPGESFYCKHCGRKFTPKQRRNRTYCSRECSRAMMAAQANISRHERAQAERAAWTPLVCKNCGKEFLPKWPHELTTRKFCCQRCACTYRPYRT